MLCSVKRLAQKALHFRIVRAVLVYVNKSGPILADSITYRALFSTFAGVLLGFSAVALWLGGNPDVLNALAASLEKVVPGLTDLIDMEMFTPPSSFTLTGLVSLAGLIAAALGAINSIRVALHTLADRPLDDISPVALYLRYALVAVSVGVLLGLAAINTWVTSIGLGNVAETLGLSQDSHAFDLAARLASLIFVFLFDLVAIAMVFRLLSGTKPSWKLVWQGSAIGAAGLLVLQEFSGLFVSGASSNPLLASFAALIALLLWFNLSAQVILIASSWIIVSIQEDQPGGDAWRHVHSIAEFNALRDKRAAKAELKRAKEVL